MNRLFFATCLAGSLWLSHGQSPFSFREVNGCSLELSDGGKPVFLYNFGMILKKGFPEEMRRSTYLHPVYAPDGTVLTDDFNPDHPHHRGISWMWPVVVVDGKIYDLWTVSGIRQKFERWISLDAKPKQAGLTVENGWYVGERKVVKEVVEIRVDQVRNNSRRMDFTLKFDAVDARIEIAGTPDQNKGFGGFCFRFAPRDGGAEKTVIRTDDGVLGNDGVQSMHAWAQLEGDFNGRHAGARIDDERSNPGFPNPWLLRHGFGFLNVSYPGLRPAQIDGRALVLKYRVTLFSGTPKAD
jgi:hypothetical protein